MYIRMYVCAINIWMFLICVSLFLFVLFFVATTFCSTLVGHGPHIFSTNYRLQSIGMRTLLICATVSLCVSLLHIDRRVYGVRSVCWSAALVVGRSVVRWMGRYPYLIGRHLVVNNWSCSFFAATIVFIASTSHKGGVGGGDGAAFKLFWATTTWNIYLFGLLPRRPTYIHMYLEELTCEHTNNIYYLCGEVLRGRCGKVHSCGDEYAWVQSFLCALVSLISWYPAMDSCFVYGTRKN